MGQLHSQQEGAWRFDMLAEGMGLELEVELVAYRPPGLGMAGVPLVDLRVVSHP